MKTALVGTYNGFQDNWITLQNPRLNLVQYLFSNSSHNYALLSELVY